MTIEEAAKKADQLTRLNAEYWNAHALESRERIRREFREISISISRAGFKVVKHCVSRSLPPTFSVKINDAQKFVEFMDNSDGNKHPGDCTTRCISFCTGVPYAEIRKEQLKFQARKRLTPGCSWMSWRTEAVWSQCLTKRGWKKIALAKPITRKRFAHAFANIPGIHGGRVATHSSGHLAAFDMDKMKILDVWNSSNGRIKDFYVPGDKFEAWKNAVDAVLGGQKPGFLV